MAVKSKTGTARIEHVPGPPKKTRQGNGKHSRARGTRKLRNGQGK